MSAGEIGLVADIGATNARFALLSPDGAVGTTRVCQIAEHVSLAAAIEKFLSEEGERKPAEAALAIAAPIAGDRVTMSNYPSWSFSIEALRCAFGLKKLLVVNDFTANAYAIPHLREGDFAQIGPGRGISGAPVAVLGPGSGLGVSALIPGPGGAVAIEGEGGHATMPAANPREAAVLGWLQARYGHVSAERLLSGPGLVNIYRALCAISGVLPQELAPAEISRAGLENKNAHAREALAMFCAMLGVFAGNLALTFGARGGVYVAGGIVPKLGDFFAWSEFRASFERKGRLKDYIAEIPTFVILRESPALLGAASLLKTARYRI